MKIKWIIVANSSLARIYSMSNNKNHNPGLSLVKELNHPESRKKGTDLISDVPGRYKARGGANSGSFASNTEPKKNEADHFTQEIAQVLEHGRTANDFDTIILVTSPHFQGLLNKHLNSHLLS